VVFRIIDDVLLWPRHFVDQKVASQTNPVAYEYLKGSIIVLQLNVYMFVFVPEYNTATFYAGAATGTT